MAPASVSPRRRELRVEPPGARDGASPSQEHSSSRRRALAAPPHLSINLQRVDNKRGGAEGPTTPDAGNHRKAGSNDQVAQTRTSQRGERKAAANSSAPKKRCRDEQEVLVHPPVQPKPVLEDQQRKAAADHKFKNDRRQRRMLDFVAH